MHIVAITNDAACRHLQLGTAHCNASGRIVKKQETLFTARQLTLHQAIEITYTHAKLQ
jgi:hypothetical protein